MNSLDNPTKNLIKDSIKYLLKIFSEHPNIFLTEADVCYHLFSILVRNIPHLLEPRKTEDNSFSIPIHLEVRWYGSSGGLKYRSDIALLNPKSLRVRDRASLRLRLPSKSYGFNDYYAIIETKFRRINGCSDGEFLNRIKRDITKLKNINKETKNHNMTKNPIYYLVCLDKKNDIKNDIKTITQSMIRPKNFFFGICFSK